MPHFNLPDALNQYFHVGCKTFTGHELLAYGGMDAGVDVRWKARPICDSPASPIRCDQNWVYTFGNFILIALRYILHIPSKQYAMMCQRLSRQCLHCHGSQRQRDQGNEMPDLFQPEDFESSSVLRVFASRKTAPTS